MLEQLDQMTRALGVRALNPSSLGLSGGEVTSPIDFERLPKVGPIIPSSARSILPSVGALHRGLAIAAFRDLTSFGREMGRAKAGKFSTHKVATVVAGA